MGHLHLLCAQIRIQDRAECGEGKELQFVGGRNTAQKNVYWEGGHCTYFLDGGTNGVGGNINLEGGHHIYFVEVEQYGWGDCTTLRDQTHVRQHLHTLQTPKRQIPASQQCLTSISLAGRPGGRVGRKYNHFVAQLA